MNDIHGIAPNALQTLNELKYLISSFGPFSSRYILTVPSYKTWHKLLLENFSHLGEIDQKRLTSILIQTNNKHAFIDQILDYWPSTKTWSINALEHWQHRPRYKPIYVSNEDFEKIAIEFPEYIKNLHQPDDILALSAADEEIETEPENYWNSIKWLSQISAEVHFIDPYFNPFSGSDVLDIFTYLIEKISTLKKITYLHFWIRIDERNFESHRFEIEIKPIIKKHIDKSKKNLIIQLHVIQDNTSINKLHARYFLTEKGGIKFDQGFQRVRPVGRKNVISPVGEDLHQKLFDAFSKNRNDFKITKTIEIRV